MNCEKCGIEVFPKLIDGETVPFTKKGKVHACWKKAVRSEISQPSSTDFGGCKRFSSKGYNPTKWNPSGDRPREN